MSHRPNEGADGVIARMWEAKAAPGRVADLVAWVCDTALPQAEHDPRHAGAEVFASTDRVVVIGRWRGEPQPLPAPPDDLVARPPHEWDFTPIDR